MPENSTKAGPRIGLGEDSHRLADGGPLRLGGIDIPHDKHALGHSDADALLHAVTDALLGAAGLPDIGELFPDNASENRGRDSAEMLTHACELVRQAGYAIVNLDCVVSAQRPKLAPFKSAIRERLATILELAPTQVNLKAKTGEGLGPVGTEQLIVARCVVLLEHVST
jgi:2-C-methyl-D-erythritol 2,4-cyclodiphosphate synthase